MLGIGGYLSDILEIVTFAVVVFLKIKKSEDQNQKMKNSFKTVCGITLLIAIICGLVKQLHWVDEVDDVLGKQISYFGASFFIGIVVPGTIIARNHNMTEYLVKHTKEIMSNIFVCLGIQAQNDFQSR